MTTHFKWAMTRLSIVAVLLLISTTALAQSPTGNIKTLTIKSTVMVYEGWQPARDPNGAVSGGLKGAEEHYKKLSDKFGYAVPVPENLVNQIGYRLLNDNKPEEAIAVFKSNTERYPNSANVYDSLAEAYERGGQLDLAEPLYDKARVLGQQNNDPNTSVYKANYERVHAKLKEKK